MSLLIAPHAFAQTNQPLTSSPQVRAAETAEQSQAEKPEQPADTGFGAIVRGTASDFASFPRRQSTWVILAIGGAAAAAAHPIDDTVNAHLQGSDAAEWFFAAGKVIGNGWVLRRRFSRHVSDRPLRHGSHRRQDQQGFPYRGRSHSSGARRRGADVWHQGQRATRPPDGRMLFVSVRPRVRDVRRRVGARTALRLQKRLADSRDRQLCGCVTSARQSAFSERRLFGSALGMASGWTVVGRHGRKSFTLLPAPIRGGVMMTVTSVPAPGPVVP